MSDQDYYETDDASRQFPWYILTGILFGLGIGLLVSLVISPVRYTDYAPSALAEAYQAQYRLTIAQAYRANQDPERASQRLALLGGGSVQDSLAAQAQQALASGDEGSARLLAELAAALNTLSTPEADFGGTPGSSASPADGAAVTPQPSPANLTLTSPGPTRAPGFVLVEQQSLCEAGVQPGLLQVEVRNTAGEGLAGVQINIAWDSGLDTFYTGLKPALGQGYADFQMTPGVTYSLRVGNSETLNDLSAPDCSAADGSSFSGGVRLVYSQ